MSEGRIVIDLGKAHCGEGVVKIPVYWEKRSYTGGWWVGELVRQVYPKKDEVATKETMVKLLENYDRIVIEDSRTTQERTIDSLQERVTELEAKLSAMKEGGNG